MKAEQVKNAYEKFLDEQFTKVKKEHRMAAAGMVFVALTALFFFLFWKPKHKTIAALEKRQKYLVGEIKKVEAIADKLDEHKAEMEKVELQLKAAAMLLPQKKEIPSLLTNISDQGTAAGLEIISFQPGRERKTSFYAEIPVSLSVKGNYHKVGTFLDKISKMSRIVAATKLSMGNPVRKEGKVNLNAKISLVTYRFIEAKEMAANKKKPRKRRRRR